MYTYWHVRRVRTSLWILASLTTYKTQLQLQLHQLLSFEPSCSCTLTLCRGSLSKVPLDHKQGDKEHFTDPGHLGFVQAGKAQVYYFTSP